MLTAGGSAVFDLVVPLLRSQGLSRPVQGVLRSGCYVTHDNGNYARFLKNVERREGLDDSLRPALEVWSMVQSVPEPGLALLTCGRRDISYDLEMPIPVAPRAARRRAAAADAPAGLDDQRAQRPARLPALRPPPARCRRSATASRWASRTPAPPSTSGAGSPLVEDDGP